MPADDILSYVKGKCTIEIMQNQFPHTKNSQ